MSASDSRSSDPAQLWSRLPAVWRALLEEVEEIPQGILYSRVELGERNQTFGVARHLPDLVAVGDDGGGVGLFLRSGPDSPVLAVSFGALGSAEPIELAPDIGTWRATGFPVALPEEQARWRVDVVLESLPGGSKKNLVAMKQELGLALSIRELLDRSRALPAVIAENQPYGRMRVRVEAVHARFGPCLSLRAD